MSVGVTAFVAQAPKDLVADPLLSAGKATPREAAKRFEGMLMAQLFQSLRKTVHSSGLFGDDATARSTYDYLLDQAVVQHAMDSGKGWGLAERLEAAWDQKGTHGAAANTTCAGAPACR